MESANLNDRERWKEIENSGGEYLISSRGRVKNVRTGKLLKPFARGKTGHLGVDLPAGCKNVHVLVAEAFIGKRPPGLEVCHGDNDPTNNDVSNLRWDTRSANVLDLRKGKSKCRNGHPWTKENIYTSRKGSRRAASAAETLGGAIGRE
ncbi:NUMOD4 motif-containing HNH endonuclease [Corynebacterium macclintockiae]|uniref:NUMOD4 motif-containing HNH endonuclease n=1 Tax=Corynebacterium macclintockiae TaxID=2913501 RepID=UPI003EBF96AA